MVSWVFKDFNKWLEKVQLRQPRMHEGNLSAWTVAPKESSWLLQGSKLCLDPNWFVSPTSCLHAHELLTKGGTWAVPGGFFYPFNTTVESCSRQSRMCFSNCERRLNSAGSRDLLTLANSERCNRVNRRKTWLLGLKDINHHVSLQKRPNKQNKSTFKNNQNMWRRFEH